MLTAVTAFTHAKVPTVGDKGALPRSLPALGLPHVPFDLHTLGIIGVPALTMAFVGLLETLLTARLVDQLTETRSNKTREVFGQGIANLVSALTTEHLADQFDYEGDPASIVIDLSDAHVWDAHVWDASAVAVLDAVTARYAGRGKVLTLVGLNPASADLHESLAGHLSTSH